MSSASAWPQALPHWRRGPCTVVRRARFADYDKACGSCGNRSVVSTELVGAFCASTAPAASTGLRHTTDACRFTTRLELGRPDGSAYGALRSERPGWICAPPGTAVVHLQWGIAPRAPVQGRGHTTDGRPTQETLTMTDSYAWFLGIDWGYHAHQVCLLDAAGRIRDTRRVDHDRAALEAYLTWLLADSGATPAQIAVAIESPRGAVVATLLERGFTVYAINPKQLDRFRDRHTAAGAKDDRRDAHVLADSVRTDRPAFRRVPLEDAVVVQLRELAHWEDQCARDLSRLTNQLRDQVYRIAPPLLRWCPAADEPWFWSLLEAAPTPVEQQHLTRTQVLTVLRTHRIRRVAAADILAAVRTPSFGLAPGVVEATRDVLQMLIPHLRLVATQRTRCAHRQAALVAALGER